MALASISEGKLIDKLKSIALLSPIAYLSYMKTTLGVIAADSFVGEVNSCRVCITSTLILHLQHEFLFLYIPLFVQMTQLLGIAEFNPKGYDHTVTKYFYIQIYLFIPEKYFFSAYLLSVYKYFWMGRNILSS